jgi:hypothetical protein
MKYHHMLLVPFLIIALNACGGGGGGGSSASDTPTDISTNAATACVLGTSTIGDCKI